MLNTNLLKNLDIKKNTNILFVYPHPDDETFANAGLIQKLNNLGVNSHILCLTKGGASTLKFSLDPEDVLTYVREKEFKTIMKYLNVTEYKILDLTDGNLEQETEIISLYIRKYIEELNPKYVVTYEPGGIYGHRDHITVSNLTTMICNELGTKVIYATVPVDYILSPSSLDMAKNPEKVKPLAPNFVLRLNAKEYVTKLKALNMYKSQVSLKHEFKHKIYQLFMLMNEYYFLPQ